MRSFAFRSLIVSLALLSSTASFAASPVCYAPVYEPGSTDCSVEKGASADFASDCTGKAASYRYVQVPCPVLVTPEACGPNNFTANCKDRNGKADGPNAS